MEELYGRQFVASQLTKEQLQVANQRPSMVKKNKKLVCQRCSSQIEESWQFPTKDYYCRSCLLMGKVTSDSPIYYFPNAIFPKVNPLIWSGTLTPYQETVSATLKECVTAKQNILVHAVTGAGKTEMIYATVASVVSQGGQVCLASPRVDVCLELYQRLKKDFSCAISLLHGQSDPYQRAPLVIATTHQLLKFYKAFDLVIIDEVDAFPFVDNEMLYFGVDNALNEDGVKVFLTATSTKELDKQVRKGVLTRLDLARRFHGNPLVVPKMVWLDKLLPKMGRHKLPLRLVKYIREQRQTRYPLLLFFPHIETGQKFTKILRELFPQERIGFVSSETENRKEIVEHFRQHKLTILVTTTILERGVTFPGVDVFVLWSNHRLYTSSSLIQISGRVGRSSDRPTGELIFFHDGLSKEMLKAKKDIRKMNRLGGF